MNESHEKGRTMPEIDPELWKNAKEIADVASRRRMSVRIELAHMQAVVIPGPQFLVRHFP